MKRNETVEVVTLTIRARRLMDEQANVVLFTNSGRGKGRKPIMFPKKCMYNFSKVIVHFPHWKGRTKEKAFQFDIPLWLYRKKKEYEIPSLGDDVIVRNTHK